MIVWFLLRFIIALLVICHSGFRFRYCTALFWEDSDNRVFSYSITFLLHRSVRSFSLHKSHGMVYSHALVKL